MIKGIFVKVSLFVGLSLFLFPGKLSAQRVSVNEEPLITKMVKRHKTLNFQTIDMAGWRIQILATTDRLRMEKIKGEFQMDFPDTPISWTHQKPYYKLRAGAYLSKIDAVRLLYQLKSLYPGAYTTKDIHIRPEEFVKAN